MINREQFIEKARTIHGDKYDYSKVEYKKVTDDVIIICPEHGEFIQQARQHYRGQGCPKCGIIRRSNKKRSTTEEFIEKAREVHGDKYDYSKVEYNGRHNDVCIICPIHGEFYQKPSCHISGKHGCPECGMEIAKTAGTKTTEHFINMAREVHGDKYDYSKVDYVSSKTVVDIICPKHGVFKQIPYVHLGGHGCQECGKEKQIERQTMTTEQFIEKARKVHGDKYDYSKVNYINIFTPVTIICPKHGEFEQIPSIHIGGSGCQKCGVTLSRAENEIYEFCKEFYPNAEQSNRSIIKPYELDIYIPEIKVAIEYNGILWHSADYKEDRNYHLKKLEACKSVGIRLIQIFEDEYVNHKEIVMEKIRHLLGKSDNMMKIMARKCVVHEIDRKTAQSFLNKYHIQGFVTSTVYLGAFYTGEIVGVMCFKREHKFGEWELTRFASNYNYVCQGVGGKMFKYFLKTFNPIKIKSFADRRWTTDEESNIYLKLGFSFDSYTKPDYKYFKRSDGIIRQHKFGFRKKLLNKKYGLPISMTESEMTKKLGYRRIFDCGLIKYVFNNR